MKQSTQIGASIKEAISLALQKLGKTPEQVDVEVLQEGKKGFFGIGSRPAEVRVTVKDEFYVEEKVVIEKSEETLSPAKEVDASVPNIASKAIPGEEKANVNGIQHDQQPEEQQQQDPIEETKAYLADIATSMGIGDLKISKSVDGKYVTLQLHSKNAARLIGKRGQTLNSLQQLAQLVLNKASRSYSFRR